MYLNFLDTWHRTGPPRVPPHRLPSVCDVSKDDIRALAVRHRHNTCVQNINPIQLCLLIHRSPKIFIYTLISILIDIASVNFSLTCQLEDYDHFSANCHYPLHKHEKTINSKLISMIQSPKQSILKHYE